MVDTPYGGFTPVTSLLDTDVLLALRGAGGINFPMSLLVRQGQTSDFALGLAVASARLHVAKASASIARFTNTQSNGGDWEFKIGGGGFIDRTFMLTDKFGGADNVRLAVDGNGNVGNGTTAPAEAHHIYRAGWCLQQMQNANGTAKLGVINGSGDFVLEASTAGKHMLFNMAGVERARLDGSSKNFVTSGTSGALGFFNGDTSGSFQGIAVRNNYGTASRDAVSYHEYLNENGVPLATWQSVLLANGGSRYEWLITPAGSRVSDRRALKMSLDVNGLYGGADNTMTLGWSGNRWSGGYIATAWVVTSDQREKLWISVGEDRRVKDRRIAFAILDELGWYQRLDAIDLKGEDDARWHFGARAQAVWAIVAAEGLCAPLVGEGPEQRPDPDWIGAPPPAWLCYDEWEDRFEPIMEEQQVGTRTILVDRVDTGLFDASGQPFFRDVTEEEPIMGMVDTGEARLVQQAGNRFGLRTDQLDLLLSWALHERLKVLEAAA